MKYDKNKNVRLILDPITIKYLPELTKVLRSLINPIINECDCSDAWEFVTRHCANWSSQIKGIDFDQSYSPLAHYDSFRINISIKAMCRITTRIFYASNVFQNTNVPINERICVSPPTYYLDCFERYYSNITLNWHEGSFCLQRMNLLQEKIQPDDNRFKYLIQWLQWLNIRKEQLTMPSKSRSYLMGQCHILQFLLMTF